MLHNIWHLSLFFTILVSIVPAGASYSTLLEGWKKRASTFINQETIGKFTPAAALMAVGLAGGLYYYLTRKNDGGDSGSSGSFKGSSTEQHVENSTGGENTFNLKQLAVYKQGEGKGGGSASCGYHTLLRGMQIVAAISERKADKELSKTLLDCSVISAYFSDEDNKGIWRQKIIESRKEVAFAEILKIQLSEAFKARAAIDQYDEKINSLYRSVIADIGNEVVGIFRRDGNLNNYEFTQEAIVKVFATSKLAPDKPEHIRAMKDKSVIENYLDLDKLVGTLSDTDFSLSVKKVEGDWLSDGELEQLWKAVNENRDLRIIPNDINCEFSPVADISFIGALDLDTVIPSVKKKLKANIPSKELFYVFGIGNMKQISDLTVTRGHWYGLVMHQKSNGTREYFVTDSMGHSRLKDEGVLKIIEALEAP